MKTTDPATLTSSISRFETRAGITGPIERFSSAGTGITTSGLPTSSTQQNVDPNPVVFSVRNSMQ